MKPLRYQNPAGHSPLFQICKECRFHPDFHLWTPVLLFKEGRSIYVRKGAFSSWCPKIDPVVSVGEGGPGGHFYCTTWFPSSNGQGGLRGVGWLTSPWRFASEAQRMQNDQLEGEVCHLLAAIAFFSFIRGIVWECRKFIQLEKYPLELLVTL